MSTAIAVLTQPIHLFDLPADIIAEITQPAYIGKSTNYVFRCVCKAISQLMTPSNGADTLCSDAAADGHLDILIWAISAGYTLNEKTTSAAASQGQLHVLEYLHNVAKCPWDSDTTFAAAAGGHLETVQYALSNGCPWTPDMFIEATKNGHRNIINYAYDTEVPNVEPSLCFWDVINLRAVVDEAIKREHIHIIKWFGIDGRVNAAIQHGSIKVIEFLVSEGTHPCSDWWVHAILHEQIPVLDWLYNYGCPGRQLVRMKAEIHDKQLVLAWADSKGL